MISSPFVLSRCLEGFKSVCVVSSSRRGKVSSNNIKLTAELLSWKASFTKAWGKMTDRYHGSNQWMFSREIPAGVRGLTMAMFTARNSQGSRSSGAEAAKELSHPSWLEFKWMALAPGSILHDNDVVTFGRHEQPCVGMCVCKAWWRVGDGSCQVGEELGGALAWIWQVWAILWSKIRKVCLPKKIVVLHVLV